MSCSIDIADEISAARLIAICLALTIVSCGWEPVRRDNALLAAEAGGRVSLQNPAFSPDGDTVLCTRFEKGYNRGPSRLLLISVWGGESTQLTADVEEDPDFMDVNLPGSCWNSTTGSITFASDREDADEVWTVQSDGSGLKRITHHSNPPYYLEPSFSPDGTWIVFEIDYPDSRWEDGLRGEIWMVRSDGTDVMRLFGSDSLDCRQPNWSPRGDRILLQGRGLARQEDWDIFVLTPQGDSLRNVTESASSDTDASFSPDGTRIVYSSDFGGLEYPNIFVIAENGGEPQRVTYCDECEDAAPSFSPDGKKVAFESHSGTDEDTPASLWIIELDNQP